MKKDRAADSFDPAGDAEDRERRSCDQPADEPAARFVMAAQKHEDREEQHERGQKRHDGAEDDGVHGRSISSSSRLSGSFAASLRSPPARMRISARMARPVMVTT